MIARKANGAITAQGRFMSRHSSLDIHSPDPRNPNMNEFGSPVKQQQHAANESDLRSPFLSPGSYHSSIDESSAERDDALQLLSVFGPSFARESRFWKSAAYSLMLGTAMGFFGLAFFNGFTKAFDTWTDYSDYHERLKAGDNLGVGSGDWWWLGVTCGGGLVVGILRVLPGFPGDVDGLFKEVASLHVHPSHSPLVFLTSMLSLALGASVGPEAAMGNLGGGLGTLLGQMRNMSDRRRAIAAFCGMAGAMGALLPSPILAVLIIHELTVTSRPADTRFNAAVPAIQYSPFSPFSGDGAASAAHFAVDQHDFMEQVTLGGIAAVAGYTVFVTLAPHTWLTPHSLPYPAAVFSQYETWHIAAAIPMGIVAGVLGIITLILLGLFRKVGKRVRMRLLSRGLRPKVVEVLLPVIGGLLFGLIGIAFPLTLGDGAMQIPYVIQHGFTGDINIPRSIQDSIDKHHHANSTVPDHDSIFPHHVEAKLSLGVLVGTLFGKLVSMAICLGFGFVGGNIFPCIFAGCCAGLIITSLVPALPVTLTVPCMMSAVPAAFAPIPFSLAGIVIIVLVLDGEMAAPVFVATFIAFWTNCGCGVVQMVVERQANVPGVMTTVRNNNNHSLMHTGRKGEGGGHGGDDESRGTDESGALQDVSSIIFAAEPGTI
jgi:H+/Cl- antiporter ClcA